MLPSNGPDTDQECRNWWIERIAKLIALWHGQKMVLHNRDGNQTVASLHGYGHYGDASERYMHAHWHEYTSAAEQCIIELCPNYQTTTHPKME